MVPPLGLQTFWKHVTVAAIYTAECNQNLLLTSPVLLCKVAEFISGICMRLRSESEREQVTSEATAARPLRIHKEICNLWKSYKPQQGLQDRRLHSYRYS